MDLSPDLPSITLVKQIPMTVHSDQDQNPDVDLSIGQLVCGMVHGSNPGDPSNGAFAEYVRARPEFVLRVPPGLAPERAAALPSGLATNLLSLWHPDALALKAGPNAPAEKPIPVLVYGGSTATGTMAIQLLRLSGLDPIATCSPRNFDLVRSYGAGAAFDYMQPGLAGEIRRHTGGRLAHAYDCIADRESVASCYGALGRAGGRYVALELVADEERTRRAVHAETILAYEIFGEDVPLSRGYGRPANKEKMRFAAQWFRVYQNLLDEMSLKPHPVQKLDGGLQAVPEGLRMLQSGSVSGKKLVILL